MFERLKSLVPSLPSIRPTLSRAAQGTLVLLGVIGATGYLLYRHPPMQTVGRGETGVRLNLFNGELSECNGHVQCLLQSRPRKLTECIACV